MPAVNIPLRGSIQGIPKFTRLSTNGFNYLRSRSARVPHYLTCHEFTYSSKKRVPFVLHFLRDLEYFQKSVPRSIRQTGTLRWPRVLHREDWHGLPRGCWVTQCPEDTQRVFWYLFLGRDEATRLPTPAGVSPRPHEAQVTLDSPLLPAARRWRGWRGSRGWRLTRWPWRLRAAASLRSLPRLWSVRPATQRWAVFVPSLDDSSAAASAPTTEGDVCLRLDSRPLYAPPWEVTTLQEKPTLSSFIGQPPTVPFVQAVNQDGPCKGSARTTKWFHGGDRAAAETNGFVIVMPGVKGIKSHSRPPETPGRSWNVNKCPTKWRISFAHWHARGCIK